MGACFGKPNSAKLSVAPEVSEKQQSPCANASPSESRVPSEFERRVAEAVRQPKWSPLRVDLELDDPWLDLLPQMNTPMSLTKVCRVQNCPLPNSHYTFCHICITCVNKPGGRIKVQGQSRPVSKAMGHGPSECGMPEEMARLRERMAGDSRRKTAHCCRVIDCELPRTHITSDHPCSRGCRGHSVATCPILVETCTESERTLMEKMQKASRHDFIPEQHWCTVAGCGRRWTHVSSGHEFLALGKAMEVAGSIAVLNLTCPKCRHVNRVEPSHLLPVFSDATCSVCMDAEANVLLPDCRHICLCTACANHMLQPT